MHFQSHHALLPLSHARPQRLERARGLLLRARRGQVWITVDGDLRDIVLEPGEQWIVDSVHPIVVSALHKSALVEVCDAARRSRERPSFWQRIVRPGWGLDAHGAQAAARGLPA